jgi:hypothetical protein
MFFEFDRRPCFAMRINLTTNGRGLKNDSFILHNRAREARLTLASRALLCNQKAVSSVAMAKAKIPPHTFENQIDTIILEAEDGLTIPIKNQPISR